MQKRNKITKRSKQRQKINMKQNAKTKEMVKVLWRKQPNMLLSLKIYAKWDGKSERLAHKSTEASKMYGV